MDNTGKRKAISRQPVTDIPYKKEKERRIQWHSAFCAAMRLELKQDEEFLQFTNEYNLNSKPLEIDLLIIKKPEKYIVKSIIGKIFKEHNIVEYKSPRDELNVDTFYKVNGYACLYKSYGRYVDEIKAEGVTISLIRDRKPVKLLNTLRKKGFDVENPFRGVYYIDGKTYFQTQVVVTKELPDCQNVWLQSLARGIDERTARELVLQAQGLKEKKDKELADSVLAVSIKVNRELFGRQKERHDMCEALKELMADEIIAEKKESFKSGKEEGLQVGFQAFVESCRELGVPYAQVIEKLEKKFSLIGQDAEECMKRYWS